MLIFNILVNVENVRILHYVLKPFNCIKFKSNFLMYK